MKIEFYRQIFENSSGIKYENPSSGAKFFHVDRQTHRGMEGQTDRQTDISKLIIAFLSIAKAPKSIVIIIIKYCYIIIPKRHSYDR